MGFLFISFIIIIICIRILAVSVSKRYGISTKTTKLEEKYLKLGFEKCYDGADKLYINQNTNQCLIIEYDTDTLFSFKEILNVEIIENGYTKMSTVSNSHVSLSKAVVGGALFGAVGAVVGGSNGKTASTTSVNDICKDLKLKITLKRINNPCIYLNINNTIVNKDSKKYRNIMDNAQYILSLFQVIIDSSTNIKIEKYFCENCGKEIGYNENFCSFCGKIKDTNE